MGAKKLGRILLVMAIGFIGACEVTPASQVDDDSTAQPTFLPGGETRATPQQLDPSENVQAGEDPEASALVKDCVYVQWCNEPGPNGTICRLRPGCSVNTSTINECIADTKAVCGTPISPWHIY